MAMAPERSRPLHNFDMPCLRWGNQRVLRCMKVNSNGEVSPFDHKLSPSSESEYKDFICGRRESNSTKQESSNSFEKSKKLLSPPIGPYGEKSNIDGDVDDGIPEVRAKLMSELRTVANKINVAIPEEGEEDELSVAAARPWNLRQRRATCTAPNDSGRGVVGGSDLAGCSNSKNEERQQNTSPSWNDNSTIKSLRLRFSSPEQSSIEKKEIPKFSIALSRQKIEDKRDGGKKDI